MKKAIALLLLCCLLLLTACGGKEPPAETAATETATAAETTTEAPDPTMPSGKAPNLDLLPEDFPPLPKGVVNLTVSHLTGTKQLTGYAIDRTRIVFECYEPVFYQFTNSLIAAGYTGSCRNIQTNDLYSLGFAGSWQNGKHIIVIDKSEKKDANLLRFTLDFAAYTDCFPHVLDGIFPAFRAASRSKGAYLGYDYASSAQNETFRSLQADPNWQWSFRFDDAFIGISEQAFRDYIDQLEQNGFNGNISQTVRDGCQVYEGDIVKSTEDGDYGIFLMYNTSLLTLDVVFTNDPAYFLGENWKGE